MAQFNGGGDCGGDCGGDDGGARGVFFFGGGVYSDVYMFFGVGAFFLVPFFLFFWFFWFFFGVCDHLPRNPVFLGTIASYIPDLVSLQRAADDSLHLRHRYTLQPFVQFRHIILLDVPEIVLK